MSDLKRELTELVAQHDTVNSTAAWEGSPNPQDPRNIRRVCKCGAIIDWPPPSPRQRRRGGVFWEPLSGHPFDPPHLAHVINVLVRWARPTREAAVRMVEEYDNAMPDWWPQSIELLREAVKDREPR